jgi:hypothetical protein
MEDVDPIHIGQGHMPCIRRRLPFLFPKAEYIDEMIEKLRNSDMTLESEDSVAAMAFLIDRNDATGEVTLLRQALLNES